MKLTKTVQKLSKNWQSDQGGGAIAPSPPPFQIYTTGHTQQLKYEADVFGVDRAFSVTEQHERSEITVRILAAQKIGSRP